jgi:hypothetical protein
MLIPFILRFQEPCTACNADSATGTQTFTNVRTEASDSDPARREGSAFPTAVSSGTQTLTFVAKEKSDTDPGQVCHDVFGVLLSSGTITRTAIKAEQSDEDRELSKMSAMPVMVPTTTLGTETFTKIRSEQADRDPGARQFHVLSECSSS